MHDFINGLIWGGGFVVGVFLVCSVIGFFIKDEGDR